MRSDLSRCAGKFVYARGGSDLLHFMPLHDFHLEPALDISVVMALRSSRLSGAEVGDMQLSRWMDISSIDPLARGVSAIINAINESRAIRVVEQHTGLGVLFETLQWMLSRQNRTFDLHYTGVGPESLRHAVELLHANEPSFHYASPQQTERVDADLTIVNHPMAVRSGEPLIDSDLSVIESRAAAFLALFVCESPKADRRVTITGHQVDLPSLDHVLDRCRQSDRFWRYRYLSGHDAGRFLPCFGQPTGLLLAYSARRALELPLFQPL